MKRLLPLLLLLFSTNVFANYVINVTWDPITTYADNRPIPDTVPVTYNLYWTVDDGATENAIPNIPIANTSFSLPFTEQGKTLTVELTAVANTRESDRSQPVSNVLTTDIPTAPDGATVIITISIAITPSP